MAPKPPHLDVDTELRSLHESERWNDVLDRTFRLYADELLGYLRAILRDHDAAADVLSMVCEDAWHGIPTFRWQCSLRAWMYVLAHHAAIRYQTSAAVRLRVRLSEVPEVANVQARLRTPTPCHLRDSATMLVDRLRARLSRDELTLLVLRVDRGLPWSEVALVLEEPSVEALRKRFERVKHKLRGWAAEARDA